MRIERVRLTPPPDAEEQLGYWVAAMDDIREELKRSLKGISENELIWQPNPEINSIGTLLLHLAHTESWWIEEMIAGKSLSAEFKKQSLFDEFGAGKTSPPAPHHPYQWYFERLDKARTRTRKTLLKLKDLNLNDIRYHEEGFERIEFSVRWILYHLVEHEAYHRGQITQLRRLYTHLTTTPSDSND